MTPRSYIGRPAGSHFGAEMLSWLHPLLIVMLGLVVFGATSLASPTRALAHKDHAQAGAALHKDAANEPMLEANEDLDDDDWGDEGDFDELEEASPESGSIEGTDKGLASTDVATPSKLFDTLAYLHAATVHMPIGWLVFLVLIELLACLGFKQDASKSTGLLLHAFCALSFIPGVVTGLTRFSMLGYDISGQEDAIFHRNVIFVSAFFVVVSLGFKFRCRDKFSQDVINTYHGIYRVLLLLALLSMVVGAHAGGAMVYGELPF
jgi:hypothetical protein